MLDKIQEAILPAINKIELTLYDMEYVKEGNEYYLRVYLDSPKGIDLEMIVEASREISDILDELDPIKDEYILEVSSPGAEKPLKTIEHFNDALNEYVRIEMKDPKEGLDAVEGYLIELDDNYLVIEYLVKTAKKQIKIDFENVKKARLAIKF
ncbi:ribosome maturation factor RimP [Bacilli bacterium PM5-3]|nr:ribosome maturation factor RimP [Bacilli bacterium PM5-3]